MNISSLLFRFSQLVDGSQVNLPNKGLNPNNSSAFSGTVQTVLRITFGTLGALAVLIIVIAAFQYVLAAGDAQKISRAREAIIYALVGLVIAVLAFAIVSFVLDGVFS